MVGDYHSSGQRKSLFGILNLEAAMKGFLLVLHRSGPFIGQQGNGSVLHEAATPVVNGRGLLRHMHTGLAHYSPALHRTVPIWIDSDTVYVFTSRTVAVCHGLWDRFRTPSAWVQPQTSIQRLEMPLGWASADPFAFVMLMSTSRCTARHSGACQCAPIDFACPRGSRFQPQQGSDSSRRARDTAATMLHFTHFWRHRGESAMKYCQLYNRTCKKCVYMNISDKNWPNNVEFRGNFHRYAPSTAGSQEIILTVELSNPKSIAHRTVVCCLRIIFWLSTWMNAPARSCYDIFFRLQTWCQNYGARTMPESARCSQPQPNSSPVLAHYGM